MIERMENQAEGNSQEVKIKISEKKVRKPNIQIAEVPERDNRKQRGKKVIIEIIQEDFLELKDTSYQKGPTKRPV